MAQTEQFMLRIGTYGPDLLDDQGRMPEYRERVTEVITPKFATSFDKEAATAEQTVAQAGVAREAEVFSTGRLGRSTPTPRPRWSPARSPQSVPEGKDSAERVDQEPVPFRMRGHPGEDRRRVAGRRLQPVTEAEQ